MSVEVLSKRIIVIEDNHDILDMLAYILRDEGYIVIPSLNSQSLKDIENHQPDLILLDDWLPDGYGHQLCLALKANAQTSKIPVILVSSVRNLPEIAKNCHANGYIAKPFDIDYLISMVKTQLAENELS